MSKKLPFKARVSTIGTGLGETGKQMNEINSELYLMIGIVAVPFLILLALAFACFLTNFSKELKYLNNEIGRTEGMERKRWVRRRRRLWLSLIPFIKY